MAAAVEECWPDVEMSGIVATRYGHSVPTKKIRVIEAGHPIPDEQSIAAANEVFAAVEHVTEQDLVLALISGGGSACLAAPVDGLSLKDLQNINEALLQSGAPIGEMNLVRQAISRIKGGKLGTIIAPAKLVTLIVSDVPGDHLDLVASGPTVSPSTSEPTNTAIQVAERYLPNFVPIIREAIERDILHERPHEANAEHVMIASNAEALRAAAEMADSLGYQPMILGDALEGESAELGKSMAELVGSQRKAKSASDRPVALISGGETTVTLNGERPYGKGGRNQEFVLSLATHLESLDGVWAISIDTDGYDGFVDAAGAITTPDTLKRAQHLGLSPPDFLERHDSYSFFEKLDDLVKIGATQTNVNDLRVVLIH